MNSEKNIIFSQGVSLKYLICGNCGTVIYLSPSLRQFLYKNISERFSRILCIFDDVVACCEKPNWVNNYKSTGTDTCKTITEEELFDMAFTAVLNPPENIRWTYYFTHADKLLHKLDTWIKEKSKET